MNAQTKLIHVAHNFRCDRDTAELGEDYLELARIERAYKLLEARLERAAIATKSRLAAKTVLELGETLADIRHDASFGSTLALAHDAYHEAMVRPVQVRKLEAVA